jgi:hypothetical protein
MEMELRYRGRVVSADDVEFIRRLIQNNPEVSRRALSRKLCEAWEWRQANGAVRDMVCRGLLLMLHRAGQIDLPAVRFVPPNPLVKRTRPAPPLIDTTRLCASLSEIQPLEFWQVRRTGDEGLFNGLMEQYHYLNYTQPVGEHLKYLVVTGGRPIACLAWSSAPRHLGSRDQFIGWSAEARRRNIRFIAYNTRFLILPWVTVGNLASHILSQMAKIVPRDWEGVYEHPIYMLETFIDPERFLGTCYRAANWIVVGQTTGRGKDDQTKHANRPIKQILVLPLVKDFRRRLGA